MSRFVVDASVAVKWVVEESGSAEALEVLESRSLSSPDLLIAECTNILWKKVKRSELDQDEAIMAARLIQQSDVEILPTRALMERALKLAVELDHAAYDCIYLSLALENDWSFVTADERLVRKLEQTPQERLNVKVLSLTEAANSPS